VSKDSDFTGILWHNSMKPNNMALKT